MAWEVEYTDEFGAWWSGLDSDARWRITSVVQVLDDVGPGLGGPLVDTISGARHANMKELRPLGGGIRMLFAFEPRRMAILLIGGDKTGRWNQWYGGMIPVADQLYDEHLNILRREGLI